MNNFKNIINKTNKIIKDGWIKGVSNGSGNAGITFETLLGKERENFEIPDYDGIEVKTKSLYGREKYMTLFNANPDSYLFQINRIHDTYGYPDKDNPEYKVFNVSLYTNRKKLINKNTIAYLHVDRAKRIIVLRFQNIYSSKLDEETTWSFDLLEEKLLRKLQKLFIVKYISKKNTSGTYFKYQSYQCYELKTFDNFIDAIEKGKVRITFSIGVFKSGKRLGQIYNHGTKFNIKLDDLSQIFTKL